VSRVRAVAELLVEAGPHWRQYVPLRATIRNLDMNASELALLDEIGRQVPAQFVSVDGGREVSWVLRWMSPLGSAKFSVVEDRDPSYGLKSPLMVQSDGNQISILKGTDLVTTLHHSGDFSKPFLHPLNGPSGASLTWNGPPDHMHHRSLWVAHGQVNGHDLWSELPGHGVIAAVRAPEAIAGPVYSELRLDLAWQNPRGHELLDERRVIRLWNVPDGQWILDHASVLAAASSDVILGDTKEGGMLCVRVAEWMEVENGGRIENSWGGINEAETWGKKANWCDYSGPMRGIWQGVAIFDHASNPRHPTYWHVRDYGLMTANAFGATAFGGREDERGGMILEKGSTTAFQYRLYVHAGDARTGQVPSRYLDYACPPKVTVLAK